MVAQECPCLFTKVLLLDMATDSLVSSRSLSIQFTKDVAGCPFILEAFALEL